MVGYKTDKGAGTQLKTTNQMERKISKIQFVRTKREVRAMQAILSARMETNIQALVAKMT
jgi:hypothetical protein